MSIGKMMLVEYQAAVARIAAKKASLTDEMIVHLWKKASESIETRDELTKNLKTSQRKVAEYYQDNDILKSRLAMLTGKHSKELYSVDHVVKDLH